MNAIGNMHCPNFKIVCLTHLVDVCHREQTYGQWAEHQFLNFTCVCMGLAIILDFVRFRITVSCICYNKN
jgi:hypothetical protein